MKNSPKTAIGYQLSASIFYIIVERETNLSHFFHPIPYTLHPIPSTFHLPPYHSGFCQFSPVSPIILFTSDWSIGYNNHFVDEQFLSGNLNRV